MLQPSFRFVGQAGINCQNTDGTVGGSTCGNNTVLCCSHHSVLSDRLGLTVRILTGLLEDLPVVITLYYAAAIIPFCRTGLD